jgi:hypothetical protein
VKLINLIGRRFGYLMVKDRAKSRTTRTFWLCICDCGKEIEINGSYLKSGNTVSCGCYRKKWSRREHWVHGGTIGRDGKPTLEYKMWTRAKATAREKGLPFDIDLIDIKIPEVCPLLGCKLIGNKGKSAAQNSPTLDRYEPFKGYVKGNVWVISYRANTIKRDLSVNEWRAFLDKLEIEFQKVQIL